MFVHTLSDVVSKWTISTKNLSTYIFTQYVFTFCDYKNILRSKDINNVFDIIFINIWYCCIRVFSSVLCLLDYLYWQDCQPKLNKIHAKIIVLYYLYTIYLAIRSHGKSDSQPIICQMELFQWLSLFCFFIFFYLNYYVTF